MSRTDQTRDWSVNWRGPAAALLLLGALSAPTVARAAATVPVLHAPAHLLVIAGTQPNDQIPVIVQAQPGRSRIESEIVRLGGHVTRNLSIIHAVAATLPARALPSLAAQPDVRWISPDASVVRSSYTCCNASTLQSVYPQAIGATKLWNAATPLRGRGIGVAIVDSGFNASNDYVARITAQVNVNSAYHHHTTDLYGHGTHVAGIVAGDGTVSAGAYVGVAPGANLINVRVADDNGAATTADVVNGLQWIYNNHTAYNIRVVNLSLNSTIADSYQVDPLDAAVETLWNAGVVVVVSAGNAGSTNTGVVYAPADDPFVITVGAVDDHGTAGQTDDTLASFSSYGTVPYSTTTGMTIAGSKPDLVAPGVNIISDLAGNSDTLAIAHPDHLVGNSYFRMSGTSMAAPMVSGAVALLLQSNPALTPNQVKSRLVSTATPLGQPGTGTGEVNVAAAVASISTTSANPGLAPAASIQAGNPAALWGSASWGSANWSSANWSSANWSSASWGSASWGSASWGSASWGSDYWG